MFWFCQFFICLHYLNTGYISYPRTETSVYPDSFDIEAAVGNQRTHPDWGVFAAQLLAVGLERSNNGVNICWGICFVFNKRFACHVFYTNAGVDCGDHPPITPMRMATERDLGQDDQWRIYEYIVRHFLGYDPLVINCTPSEYCIFLWNSWLSSTQLCIAGCCLRSDHCTISNRGRVFRWIWYLIISLYDHFSVHR